MSWLFDKSFQERADLQRRQIYHQQQLDSQSFRHWQDHDATGARSHERTSGEGGGAIGAIGGFIALVCFVYTIPAAALSTAAAIPAMLAMTFATRALSGQWPYDLRNVFVSTAIGIFIYLTSTLLVGLGIYFLRDEMADMKLLQAIFAAVFHLCSQTVDSLSLIGSGSFSIARLFGFVGDQGESLSMRFAALTTLHGSGVLLCAWVIAKRIGSPFHRSKGFLAACIVSAATVPLSVGSALWVASRCFS